MKTSSIALTKLLVAAFLISANGQLGKEAKTSAMKTRGRVGQRCLFTVITMRHFITTASCVVWQSVEEGTVSTRLFELTPVLPLNEGHSIEETYTTFETITHVHPYYIAGQNKRYNVAVLALENDLPERFSPMLLGEIHRNSNCDFYGDSAFWQRVMVLGPELCDANSPQAFCSRATVSQPLCAAVEAATLTCERGVLNGFLISSAFCPNEPAEHNLYYHSVGDFRAWIRSIIDA